jgi:hypothetical protein
MPVNNNLIYKGLNSPIKRCRLVDWILKKTQLFVVCKNKPHRHRCTQTGSEKMENDITSN